MDNKQPLGEKFLESSAISVYGIWIIIFSFPLILAGIIFLIDETRSTIPLILSSIAIGIIAASYILRFYLVRNTQSLRLKVLLADGREQALKIITGGFLVVANYINRCNYSRYFLPQFILSLPSKIHLKPRLQSCVYSSR